MKKALTLADNVIKGVATSFYNGWRPPSALPQGDKFDLKNEKDFEKYMEQVKVFLQNLVEKQETEKKEKEDAAKTAVGKLGTGIRCIATHIAPVLKVGLKIGLSANPVRSFIYFNTYSLVSESLLINL